VLKANLGSSQNERLSEISMHLSAQQMEVVAGGCHLSELEINVLRGQIVVRTGIVVGATVDILKETFHMASGVLWASTIEAMRQQEDETRLAEPLSFRAHNVLINY